MIQADDQQIEITAQYQKSKESRLYGTVGLSKNKQYDADWICTVIDVSLQALFICNAQSLQKLVCIRLPTHYGIEFTQYCIFPHSEAFMCIATNAIVHVSIDAPRKQSIMRGYKEHKMLIDKAYDTYYMSPVEVTLPRAIPLFRKYISISGSLAKWESLLTSNKVVDYDLEVSKKHKQKKKPQ